MFAKYLVILSIILKLILMENDCEEGKCELIIDGENTTIEEFPHTVALLIIKGKRRVLRCGGSVLNQRIILTAAHCVILKENNTQGVEERTMPILKKHPNSTFIAAGHENYRKANILRKVIKVIAHECYVKKHNDIALMLINEDLPFGDTIKRVMITKEFPAGVKRTEVSGWGDIDEYGNKTIYLKFVEMKVYSQKKCCKILRHRYHPGVLCTGDRHSRQTKNQAFKGDSGGPVVISRHHQIGVVSYGFVSGRKKGIDVYTNVSYYYDWIRTRAEKLYCKTKYL